MQVENENLVREQQINSLKIESWARKMKREIDKIGQAYI
jgi:hypothetical protein